MTRYLGRRLVHLIFVLIGVSIVVFLTMHVLPGDVATLLLGDRATAEQLENLRRQLGLDQPIYVQFLRFASDALHGDFGTSLRSNHPAFDDVWNAFPVTMQLSLAALLRRRRHRSACRRPGRAPAVVTLRQHRHDRVAVRCLDADLLARADADPGLRRHLDWLPIGGVMPIGVDVVRVTGMSVVDSLLERRWDHVLTSLRHLALPALTLGMVPLALITRITRSEMLSMRANDHVRTARAKGLSESRVVLKHMLRNALIPVVTVIGLQVGLLLSGAVLTETIYSLPGIGRLMVNAIFDRDYPVVQAAALLAAFVFVVANLVVDLSYAYLDPRIRYR